MLFQSKTEAAVPGMRSAAGLKVVMWVAMLAVGGSVALSAWAQPAPPPGGPAAGPQGGPPPRHAMPHGPRAEGFGPGLFMGRPEHVDRGVDRLLRGLNASDAQRSEIKQIARAAAADLMAQHEANRGLHGQELQLFAAPTVDARAVEDLRQKRLAQHDQASKRISQALLDVSAVLSPEQRAQLVARAKERRERMKERLQNRSFERRGAASAPAR